MLAPSQTGMPANVQFARNRLMQARQQGILPTNFQVGHTVGNIMGQFKQLNPAIGQARVSTTPTAAHQLINQAIRGLGNNNLMTNPADHPSYGAMPPHPLAAPMHEQAMHPMQPIGHSGIGQMPGPVTLPLQTPGIGQSPLPGSNGILQLLQTLLAAHGQGQAQQGAGYGAVGGGY